MTNLLKKLLSESLSDGDIMRLIDGKANLILYPELVEYDNIDDVLGIHKACVILYETKRNYGHWVCVIKHSNKHIEVFDSYGTFPDDQLKYIPENYKKQSGQEHSLLTNLLLKSRCKIEYNHDKLQKFKENINTCGRWVAFRIICRKLPLKKFVKLFKNKKSPPDVLVSILTTII
jgi:hypothetical protein